MKFFEIYFNASANGIEVKSFDNSLTHWVTNQGDDIVVEVNRNDDTERGVNFKSKLRVKKHTLPCKLEWSRKDIGLESIDLCRPAKNIINTSSDEIQERNLPNGLRKINPIVYKEMKLNRAVTVANFFNENENNYPFIAVVDGNVNNLCASNLYWTDRNLFPILNIQYEAMELNREVVIHTPQIRALRENMNLYGWDKVFTKVTVPVPNDLLHFFQSWKISIQSAVFTSLRFISQWSFCVYSIEYDEGKEVFVGYAPHLDGIYVDQIFKVGTEVPRIHEILFNEGHGVLKVKYLTLSMSRREAFDSAVRFMNEYHNLGWKLLNTDFYTPHIERQLYVCLKNEELEAINEGLMKEKGYDLQTYLNALVKNLRKKHPVQSPDEGDEV